MSKIVGLAATRYVLYAVDDEGQIWNYQERFEIPDIDDSDPWSWPRMKSLGRAWEKHSSPFSAEESK